MADPSVHRETTIYKAKQAEETERYDDMVIEMSKVVKMEGELTEDERNLLSTAYKNATGIHRAAWKILHRNWTRKGWARRMVIESLSDICGDIVVIIDNHLIPNCNAGDPSARAYYFKMKGDYNRYLAEFRTGVERQVACDELVKAYETLLGRDYCLHIPFDLAWFEFFGVVPQDPFFQWAIEIAEEAFNEAISELDNLNDEQAYKDMQSLWNNLV